MILIYHLVGLFIVWTIYWVRKSTKADKYSYNRYMILYKKEGKYIHSALLKWSDAISRYSIFDDARFICKVIKDKKGFFAQK